MTVFKGIPGIGAGVGRGWERGAVRVSAHHEGRSLNSYCSPLSADWMTQDVILTTWAACRIT